MDQFGKRFEKEFQKMEHAMGRMLRNMSFSSMSSVTRHNWHPPADVFETADEITIYLDVAGIDPGDITVEAQKNAVTVSGVRPMPDRQGISCVQQLEIDRGRFSRTIHINALLDVASATSSYRNGLLEIRLPKEKPKKVVISAL